MKVIGMKGVKVKNGAKEYRLHINNKVILKYPPKLRNLQTGGNTPHTRYYPPF